MLTAGKNFFSLFLLLILITFSSFAMSKEVTIFDSSGNPTAFIDTDADENIYLWDGRPVAYLDGSDIYGFNGNHLCWVVKGVLYNQEGYQVGFFAGATDIPTSLEVMKGLKKLAPLKSLKQLKSSLYVRFKAQWKSGLDQILLEGAK